MSELYTHITHNTTLYCLFSCSNTEPTTNVQFRHHTSQHENNELSNSSVHLISRGQESKPASRPVLYFKDVQALPQTSCIGRNESETGSANLATTPSKSVSATNNFHQFRTSTVPPTSTLQQPFLDPFLSDQGSQLEQTPTHKVTSSLVQTRPLQLPHESFDDTVASTSKSRRASQWKQVTCLSETFQRSSTHSLPQVSSLKTSTKQHQNCVTVMSNLPVSMQAHGEVSPSSRVAAVSAKQQSIQYGHTTYPVVQATSTDPRKSTTLQRGSRLPIHKCRSTDTITTCIQHSQADETETSSQDCKNRNSPRREYKPSQDIDESLAQVDGESLLSLPSGSIKQSIRQYQPSSECTVKKDTPLLKIERKATNKSHLHVAHQSTYPNVKYSGKCTSQPTSYSHSSRSSLERSDSHGSSKTKSITKLRATQCTKDIPSFTQKHESNTSNPSAHLTLHRQNSKQAVLRQKASTEHIQIPSASGERVEFTSATHTPGVPPVISTSSLGTDSIQSRLERISERLQSLEAEINSERFSSRPNRTQALTPTVTRELLCAPKSDHKTASHEKKNLSPLLHGSSREVKCDKPPHSFQENAKTRAKCLESSANSFTPCKENKHPLSPSYHHKTIPKLITPVKDTIQTKATALSSSSVQVSKRETVKLGGILKADTKTSEHLLPHPLLPSSSLEQAMSQQQSQTTVLGIFPTSLQVHAEVSPSSTAVSAQQPTDSWAEIPSANYKASLFLPDHKKAGGSQTPSIPKASTINSNTDKHSLLPDQQQSHYKTDEQAVPKEETVPFTKDVFCPLYTKPNPPEVVASLKMPFKRAPVTREGQSFALKEVKNSSTNPVSSVKHSTKPYHNDTTLKSTSLVYGEVSPSSTAERLSSSAQGPLYLQFDHMKPKSSSAIHSTNADPRKASTPYKGLSIQEYRRIDALTSSVQGSKARSDSAGKAMLGQFPFEERKTSKTSTDKTLPSTVPQTISISDIASSTILKRASTSSRTSVLPPTALTPMFAARAVSISREAPSHVATSEPDSWKGVSYVLPWQVISVTSNKHSLSLSDHTQTGTKLETFSTPTVNLYSPDPDTKHATPSNKQSHTMPQMTTPPVARHTKALNNQLHNFVPPQQIHKEESTSSTNDKQSAQQPSLLHGHTNISTGPYSIMYVSSADSRKTVTLTSLDCRVSVTQTSVYTRRVSPLASVDSKTTSATVCPSFNLSSRRPSIKSSTDSRMSLNSVSVYPRKVLTSDSVRSATPTSVDGKSAVLTNVDSPTTLTRIRSVTQTSVNSGLTSTTLTRNSTLATQECRSILTSQVSEARTTTDSNGMSLLNQVRPSFNHRTSRAQSESLFGTESLVLVPRVRKSLISSTYGTRSTSQSLPSQRSLTSSLLATTSNPNKQATLNKQSSTLSTEMFSNASRNRFLSPTNKVAHVPNSSTFEQLSFTQKTTSFDGSLNTEPTRASCHNVKTQSAFTQQHDRTQEANSPVQVTSHESKPAIRQLLNFDDAQTIASYKKDEPGIVQHRKIPPILLNERTLSTSSNGADDKYKLRFSRAHKAFCASQTLTKDSPTSEKYLLLPSKLPTRAGVPSVTSKLPSTLIQTKPSFTEATACQSHLEQVAIHRREPVKQSSTEIAWLPISSSESSSKHNLHSYPTSLQVHEEMPSNAVLVQYSSSLDSHTDTAINSSNTASVNRELKRTGTVSTNKHPFQGSGTRFMHLLASNAEAEVKGIPVQTQFSTDQETSITQSYEHTLSLQNVSGSKTDRESLLLPTQARNYTKQIQPSFPFAGDLLSSSLNQEMRSKVLSSSNSTSYEGGLLPNEVSVNPQPEYQKANVIIQQPVMKKHHPSDSITHLSYAMQKFSFADSQLHSPHLCESVPTVKINQFIRRTVIDNLYQQKIRSQFAALILLTRSESWNISTTKLMPFSNNMTNPGRSFMPEEKNFGNYIVARPDEASSGYSEYTHAEVIIFRHLSNLLKAFKNLKHEEPALVFLYSWITPCEECTKLIVKYAREMQPARMIVAYTIDYWRDTEDAKSVNHHRLKENNIDVHQVDYDKRI